MLACPMDTSKHRRATKAGTIRQEQQQQRGGSACKSPTTTEMQSTNHRAVCRHTSTARRQHQTVCAVVVSLLQHHGATCHRKRRGVTNSSDQFAHAGRSFKGQRARQESRTARHHLRRAALDAQVGWLISGQNALDAGRSSSRAQQQRLLIVSRQLAEAGRVRAVLGLGHLQQRRPRGDACGRHQRGDGDDLFIGTPWPKTS